MADIDSFFAGISLDEESMADIDGSSQESVSMKKDMMMKTNSARNSRTLRKSAAFEKSSNVRTRKRARERQRVSCTSGGLYWSFTSKSSAARS
jgi:hypothetical protein